MNVEVSSLTQELCGSVGVAVPSPASNQTSTATTAGSTSAANSAYGRREGLLICLSTLGVAFSGVF